MMVNIFTYRLFVYLFWRNVYSDPLIILIVTCLFSVELQVSIMYSRYKSHQIYYLQIFSPISWVGFSLCLLMHTILNFYVVQFFWFFFCCLLFWCHVQEIIAKELYCLSKTFQVPNFVLVSMGSDPVLDIFSFLVSMFILSVNVQLLIYVSTHWQEKIKPKRFSSTK